MILDKKGKVFGKINIIDFCVILAVVIAVVGIFGRFIMPIGTQEKESVKNEVKLSYVIQVDAVRIFSVNAFKKAGPVMDRESGMKIGDITHVEELPYKSNYMTKDGNVVQMEMPENYSALITVESTGYETESGYFVSDGTELVLGNTVSMVTKYVNLGGVIKSIEKIN